MEENIESLLIIQMFVFFAAGLTVMVLDNHIFRCYNIIEQVSHLDFMVNQ